jgi:uncharacterized membrane protein
MIHHLALTICSFAVLAGLSSPVVAQAGKPQFITIDIPNAACGTFATAINSRLDVVGTISTCNNLEGFLLSNRFVPINVPDTFSTAVHGINAQGDIVGVYAATPDDLSQHGFLLRHGRYTTIAGPNGVPIDPAGINAEGDIVGTYFDPQDQTSHGFLLRHGRYITIDHPDATFTFPAGINDKGDIVGTYASRFVVNGQDIHGFLLHRPAAEEDGSGHDDAGAFTDIDAPGADFTNANGINSEGDVVGNYYSFAHGFFHGFVLHRGRYTTIDDPHADQNSGGTGAAGINSEGDVVGQYTDSAGQTHGFVLLSR